MGIPDDVAFYGASTTVNASGLSEANAAGLTALGVRDWSRVLCQSPPTTPGSSASFTFSLALSAQPTASVVATLSVAPTAAGASVAAQPTVVLSRTSLVFDPARWNSSFDVTISVPNDGSGSGIAGGVASLAVTALLTSSDPAFDTPAAAIFPSSAALAFAVVVASAAPPDLTPPPQLVNATLAEDALTVMLAFSGPTTAPLPAALAPAAYPATVAVPPGVAAVRCNVSGLLSPASVWLLDGGAVYPATVGPPLAGTGTGAGTPPGGASYASFCYWAGNATLVVAYDARNARWPQAGDVLALAGTAIRASATAALFATGSVVVSPRLAVPAATSAVFLSSGSAVQVTFSAPAVPLLTPPGAAGPTVLWPASAPCSAVVVPAASLGFGAVCGWASATQLVVRLGSGATLLPAAGGSVAAAGGARDGLGAPSEAALAAAATACGGTGSAIVLQPGAVRATVTSVAGATGCVSVAAPASTAVATAVLAGPTSVGLCDGIFLDASQSPSIAGRANSYAWTVTPANSVAAAATGAANISAYLGGFAVADDPRTGFPAALTPSQASSRPARVYDFVPSELTSPLPLIPLQLALPVGARSTLRLPPSTLAPGGAYLVTLRVSNFLFVSAESTPLAQANASATVSVAAAPLPLVSIDSPGAITTPTGAAASVRLLARLPSCGVNASSSLAGTRLAYSWAVSAAIDATAADPVALAPLVAAATSPTAVQGIVTANPAVLTVSRAK